jgi:hypothetical protein
MELRRKARARTAAARRKDLSPNATPLELVPGTSSSGYPWGRRPGGGCWRKWKLQGGAQRTLTRLRKITARGGASGRNQECDTRKERPAHDAVVAGERRKDAAQRRRPRTAAALSGEDARKRRPRTLAKMEPERNPVAARDSGPGNPSAVKTETGRASTSEWHASQLHGSAGRK